MRFESMGFTEYGPWESSGSEHSAEESSLSDMVNSYLEKDFYEDGQGFEAERDDEERHHGDADQKHDETKIELRRQICVDKDSATGSLLDEVEKARQDLEDSRSIGCRELMCRLRARGLDAGLCKSKWQKQGCIPAGEHEYIDIINTDNNTRYIVELSLIEQFTIARPTSQFTSLLNMIPEIYIGTVEEMKQLVKLMCKAMKASMGCRDMKVPPWRKYEYMKAKWFGCYKRSTQPVSTKIFAENAWKSCHQSHHSGDRSVGFEVVVLNGYVLRSYRDEVSKRTRMEHGLLATAFRAQRTEF